MQDKKYIIKISDDLYKYILYISEKLNISQGEVFKRSLLLLKYAVKADQMLLTYADKTEEIIIK